MIQLFLFFSPFKTFKKHKVFSYIYKVKFKFLKRFMGIKSVHGSGMSLCLLQVKCVMRWLGLGVGGVGMPWERLLGFIQCLSCSVTEELGSLQWCPEERQAFYLSRSPVQFKVGFLNLGLVVFEILWPLGDRKDRFSHSLLSLYKLFSRTLSWGRGTGDCHLSSRWKAVFGRSVTEIGDCGFLFVLILCFLKD